MNLSVIAIARDEAVLIGDMLTSVANLGAAELVIGVDDRTTDSTAVIASEYGAHVVPFTWSDSFSAALNGIIDAATGDWILRLDCDERLTAGGAAIVRDVLSSASETPGSDSVGSIALEMLEVDRQGTILRQRVGPGRLFRNLPHLRYGGRVHEEIMGSVGVISGVIGVVHVGFDEELAEERGKVARNRRLLEMDLADNSGDAAAARHLARMEVLREV